VIDCSQGKHPKLCSLKSGSVSVLVQLLSPYTYADHIFIVYRWLLQVWRGRPLCQGLPQGSSRWSVLKSFCCISFVNCYVGTTSVYRNVDVNLYSALWHSASSAEYCQNKCVFSRRPKLAMLSSEKQVVA